MAHSLTFVPDILVNTAHFQKTLTGECDPALVSFVACDRFSPRRVRSCVKCSRRKHMAEPIEVEHGPALGISCTVRRVLCRAAERPD